MMLVSDFSWVEKLASNLVSILIVGKSLRSATSVAVCVEVCKLLGNSNGRVVDATT